MVKGDVFFLQLSKFSVEKCPFLSEVAIEARYDANCDDNLKSIGTFYRICRQLDLMDYGG